MPGACQPGYPASDIADRWAFRGNWLGFIAAALEDYLVALYNTDDQLESIGDRILQTGFGV